MAARRSLFLSSKQLFLLGTPISASPSPDMHNAAFTRIGLPWNYDLFDTPDVTKYVYVFIRISCFHLPNQSSLLFLTFVLFYDVLFSKDPQIISFVNDALMAFLPSPLQYPLQICY